MGSHCLETNRLRLSPLAPADTDALHRLWTDLGPVRFLFRFWL